MVKAKEAVALIERIKELLAEKKAENVVALDLRRVSETLDYFVVASATSTPHLQALERHLLEKLEEEEDLRPRPTAGQSPRWVVLDYGEVVVHLMTPEAREYYDLEGFWADAERL
ncbi:ribosomal silencing factor RsfS [Thermus thermophilus]|uniref:ribosome silencing factor n=1 Tax=Thermus thermophilus TaxID=274 RepID=UPI00194E6223|nr:ribosome silencing factor [Thermus thermophilus]BCP98909.1 ribosomal silencing factor RsfS [Thermus thermophilus]BCQ01240.1 ribosomal silencing factor RsfS [Thermus thermophilus]